MIIPKGTLVTCPQCGAAICQTKIDLEPGTPVSTATFCDWWQVEPRPGSLGPLRCRECDAAVIHIGWSPKVHFRGLGWQPAKPEAEAGAGV